MIVLLPRHTDTLRAHSIMESPGHHVPLNSQTTPTTPAPILAASTPATTHAITHASPLTTPTYLPQPYPGGYPLTPVAAPTLPRGRGLFTSLPPTTQHFNESTGTDDCASVSDAGKTTSSRDRLAMVFQNY